MSLFRPTFYERDLERDAKIEAKREIILGRREQILDRMLDAKNRRMGVDANALDIQAEESRQRKLAQKASTAGDAAENQRIVDSVTAIERGEAAQRKALLTATGNYVREQIAHPERRDTYDLNDKHRVIHTAPVRVGDDDPRLGPASVQVFAGEDILAGERRKLQHAQMQTWTAQQTAEKVARATAEKEEDRAYMAWYNANEASAGGMAATLEAEVKARQVQAAAWNKRQMVQDAERRKAFAKEEKMMGMVAMETLTMRGAGMGMLAEDIADGMSCADPRRYRPDYYRGLPSSAAPYAAALDEQVAVKARAKAREVEEEEGRVRAAKAELRAAYLQERENQARALALKSAAKVALDEQMADGEARRRAAKAEDKGRPAYGPEFFNSFGKSLF